MTTTFISKEELAKALQCSVRTVDNLRARGMPVEMMHVSPMRMAPRFDLAACQKWLAAHQVEQAQAVLDTAVQVGEKIRRKREGSP